MFHVPPSPSYALSRAPLAQALAQVRYPVIASLETTAGIAPLQDRMRHRFPFMEQRHVQEVALAIGPAGPVAPPQSASSVTWELSAEDGFLLIVGSTNATLSVGESYDGVAGFEARFREVLEALRDAVSIPRCDRLGLRYLSIAEDLPSEHGAWMQWFRPELAGWAKHVVTGALNSMMTQTQLRQGATDEWSTFSDAVHAIVRHGFAPPGSDVPGIPPLKLTAPSFLLDLDLFSIGKQPFDVDVILAQFRMLHSQIDRFFYWALTDDGKDYFGLELRNE